MKECSVAKINQLLQSTSKEIKKPLHPQILLRFNEEGDLKFKRESSRYWIFYALHFFGQTFDKKKETLYYMLRIML